MKRMRNARRLEASSLAFAAAALCVTGAVSATAAARPSDAPDVHEADRQALRDLKALYEKAASTGDIDALAPLVGPGFTGVMMTSDPVASVEDMRSYWARMRSLIGDGGSYRVELAIDGPSEFFGDIAVAHGTSKDFVHTGSGRDYNFDGRWTAVFRRTPEGWKALRIHGSMDPIGNPFVRAGVSGTAWVVGIVAVLVGALLGWIGRSMRSGSDRPSAGATPA